MFQLSRCEYVVNCCHHANKEEIQLGLLIRNKPRQHALLGRCEASWGEPEWDMTVSTRLRDSVFTETHGLENALKSEYE